VKIKLLILGFWVRYIILGLLYPLGMVHLTAALVRIFYRIFPPMARRPIWTAVITNLAILIALLWGASVVLCRLVRLCWTNT